MWSRRRQQHFGYFVVVLPRSDKRWKITRFSRRKVKYLKDEVKEKNFFMRQNIKRKTTKYNWDDQKFLMVFDVYFSSLSEMSKAKRAPKTILKSRSEIKEIPPKDVEIITQKDFLDEHFLLRLKLPRLAQRYVKKASIKKSRKKIRIKGKIGHHEELMQTGSRKRMPER